MAENITTLLEKWQKQQQEHPEWTPSLEDLLYFIHGSGSDRDRLYSIEELRDFLETVITDLTGLKNISISYSSNDDGITLTGSNGSIYIEGGNPPRIRFESGQGGPRSELTHNGLKLVKLSGTSSEKSATMSLDSDGNFTADTSHVLESSQATPRQFKSRNSGNTAYSLVDYDKVRSLDGRGYTDVTPSGIKIADNQNHSGSIGYDSTNDAMSFEKPPISDVYMVGNKFKVVATDSTSGAFLSVEYLEDGDWVQKAFFSADGKKLQVKAQLAHTASNWIYSSSDVDFQQSGTHDLANFEVDAPFAIFNTNDHGGTSIQVIDPTGNRVYGVEAGCARWFVKTKVGSTDTLFAFGKEP